jgi:predicted adenine nucleotide alpha hydrolase (AANH) superfamily ATPase
MRLEYVAHIAKRGRFDAFTSTLLISPHQKHDLARSIGESVAKEMGVGFLYHDFREMWRDSRALSNEFDLYHQQYCGCIYSELERYGAAPRTRP